MQPIFLTRHASSLRFNILWNFAKQGMITFYATRQQYDVVAVVECGAGGGGGEGVLENEPKFAFLLSESNILQG